MKAVKRLYCPNIYDSVVLKDIIMRNKVASPNILEKSFELCYCQFFNKLFRGKFNISCSDRQKPVSIGAYCLRLLEIQSKKLVFAIKFRDTISAAKKPLPLKKKIYVCDLGFFHLKKNRVKDEYSYLVETVCYNELISRGYHVFIGKNS